MPGSHSDRLHQLDKKGSQRDPFLFIAQDVGDDSISGFTKSSMDATFWTRAKRGARRAPQLEAQAQFPPPPPFFRGLLLCLRGAFEKM
jgi:hypothetical protein